MHLFCIPNKKWSHVVLQIGPEELSKGTIYLFGYLIITEL